jgi:hypothetical protein
VTLLDQHGRSQDAKHRAACLISWLQNPKIGKLIRQHVWPSEDAVSALKKVLALYSRPNGTDPAVMEETIRLAVKHALSNRLVRRAIAADLSKGREVSKGEVMEALRRLGGEDA